MPRTLPYRNKENGVRHLDADWNSVHSTVNRT